MYVYNCKYDGTGSRQQKYRLHVHKKWLSGQMQYLYLIDLQPCACQTFQSAETVKVVK